MNFRLKIADKNCKNLMSVSVSKNVWRLKDAWFQAQKFKTMLGNFEAEKLFGEKELKTFQWRLLKSWILP